MGLLSLALVTVVTRLKYMESKSVTAPEALVPQHILPKVEVACARVGRRSPIIQLREMSLQEPMGPMRSVSKDRSSPACMTRSDLS